MKYYLLILIFLTTITIQSLSVESYQSSIPLNQPNLLTRIIETAKYYLQQLQTTTQSAEDTLQSLTQTAETVKEKLAPFSNYLTTQPSQPRPQNLP